MKIEESISIPLWLLWGMCGILIGGTSSGAMVFFNTEANEKDINELQKKIQVLDQINNRLSVIETRMDDISKNIERMNR